MFRPFAIVGLAVVSLLSLASIGAAESKGGAKADTPEGAARQFLEALAEQDKQAYEASTVQGDLAKNVFRFATAAESFKKKMLAAYGEVGWKNFQDDGGARIRLSYNDLKVSDLEFETEGDTAKASSAEDDEIVLRLVRKDGIWLVDLEKSLESQTQNGGLTSKSLGEAFGSMAKTMQTYEAKIGEGTTVDELDKAMGAEFLSALLEAGAKPKISVSVTPK